MLSGFDDLHDDMSAFNYASSGRAIPVPSRAEPAMARSMSAPDFVADEWERFMDSKRGDQPLKTDERVPSAASSRHPSLQCFQQPTLPLAPPPGTYLQQHRWCAPTTTPTVTSGLTQSLSAQQAMLLSAGRTPVPKAPHDPHLVLDSSIRKLKRRGRKLYEELETIAVKLDLLERARATYGP